MRTIAKTAYRGAVKPPSGAQLDVNHPLARDLRGFWLLDDSGQKAFEYVRGYPSLLNAGSALGWSPTPRGVGVLMDATNPIRTNPGAAEAVDAFTQPSLPISIVGCCRPDSLSTARCLYATQAFTSPARYAGARINIEADSTVSVLIGNNTGGTSSNRRSKVSSLTVPGVGKLTTIGTSLRGNTDMSIYIDGKDAGGTTSGTGAGLAYNSTNAGQIGAIVLNATGFSGVIVWVGLWARSLSPEEHLQLAVDPFCMFGATAIYLPPLGSATVTGAASLSGVGSLTVAGSHTAFASVALTGSGSQTSAGVRTRFAIAAIAGAGTLTADGLQTATGASTLAGTGSLTGNGFQTATGGGTLTGAGSLTATGGDIELGMATLAGAGSLTAAGVRVRFGVAAMPGAGSLAAAGALTAIGAAILEGLGTLLAAGRLEGAEPPVTTATRSGPASGRTDTDTAPGTTRSSSASGRTRSTLGDN